jgi:transporter family-2 protein
MNPYLAALGALLLGAILVFQTAVNTRLKDYLHSPILVAFVGSVIGTTILLGLTLLGGHSIPPRETLARIPLYAWVGGVCGVIIVAGIVFLARPLGAAALVMLILTGQLITALIIDHYGLFGFDTRALSLPRVCGVLLLIAGAALVKFAH